MSTYKTVFPKKHTLLVVVHVESMIGASRNVSIAKDNGADGVFLINHGDTAQENVQHLIVIEKTAYPDFWIGANFLGYSTLGALHLLPKKADGLWTDNADIGGLLQAGIDGERYKRLMCNAHREKWNGLYFGGVAFKYQPTPVDVEMEARNAKEYVDVITTSGERTGMPPSLEKIRKIRNAIGTFPLAIASGMTPENVVAYKDLADCFLVSTGISYDFYHLNPKKVEQFARAIQ